MQKMIFIPLFLMLAVVGFGQQKTQWSLGGALAYTGVIIQDNDLVSGFGLGILGGLKTQLTYNFSEHSALRTGIQLSYHRTNVRYHGLTWGSDWDSSTNKNHENVTIDKLNFVSADLSVAYVYKIKPRLNIQLGVVPQIRLANSAEWQIHYPDGWKSDQNQGSFDPEFQNVNVGLYAGIGMVRSLSSKILIELTPFFQMNLQKDVLHSFSKKNLQYQAGVSFVFMKNKE